LRNDQLLERIESDFHSAGLDARRAAMLSYVEKLTETPSAVSKEDVDLLRGAGFSDRDILEIVEVAAYYAYVNRVADGLGVRVEEELGL
jgi:uncharacterized peroxidase-related enzyme